MPFDVSVGKHVYAILKQQKTVVVSFSCGPDSVFLSLWLSQRFPKIKQILIYFDHGLRSRYAIFKEKQFIRQFALDQGHDYRIRKIPVKLYAKKNQQSLEEAGRTLRLNSLLRLSNILDVSVVLKAHHLDDLVETMMLQLLRGVKTNFEGIRDMRKLSEEVTLCRPLLQIEKSTILETLKEKKQTYSLDSSNKNLVFMRNRVRHNIVPEFERLNANYRQHFYELAQYNMQKKDFLKKLCKPLLESVEWKEFQLIVPRHLFMGLDPFLQRQVLFYLLENFKQKWNRIGDIKQVHVEGIWGLIKQKKSGLHYSLPGGTSVYIDYDRVVFFGNENLVDDICYDYQIESVPSKFVIPESNQRVIVQFVEPKEDKVYLSKCNEVFLAVSSQHLRISVRNLKPGDRFIPFGHKRLQLVSRYFKKNKISKMKRHQIPLFFVEDDLAWISGVQSSESFRVTDLTPFVLNIKIDKI